LNRKRRTTKQFLGSLDVIHKKYKKGERPTFSLGTTHDEFLVDLIRGPDPEFRDPCRFALLDAFPDKAQQKLLGEIIASIVELPLDDLAPDAFADALAADPEHALEDYIELVDRVWGLGKLLGQARRERPNAKNLGRVQQAFERWDEASRSVIRRGLGIDDTTVKKNIEEFG
jgi:hypothetical protein